MLERLKQGPGEEARQEVTLGVKGLPPSRWTLATIRATFPEIGDYTLSGVWRWLRCRVGAKLRSGRVQQYSPDPEYRQKVRRLKRCLRKAVSDPERVVLVFLDEMGYESWPETSRDWICDVPGPPPLADRQESDHHLWRIVGVMNALTGQVNYLDGYIVGRKKLIEMYGLLARTYPKAETIYVVQDNWSIHTHDDVLTALMAYPHIKPVWLPTYAPWLNPIEKLWRWLRQDVLKLHRLAHDWKALQARVNGFLDQFAQGSDVLLKYVGLKGSGQLATALRPP